MHDQDKSFNPDTGLEYAVELLRRTSHRATDLPRSCPLKGLGETGTLDLLAPQVLGGAAHLGKPDAIAHMDPPTPWITWATALWNASLNQNLLHPATAPFARDAERKVIDWLTPFFGMHGGHMCSGSTLANLTALWAARDSRGINRVVASAGSHLSIQKSAHLLGMAYEPIATNARGQLDADQLGDCSDACLVLTAGTTTTGEIDPLTLVGQAKWTHVDAAWAGALRLSPTHHALLDGIENADSVALSAHKWLFQPKDSALVMFRDLESANAAISFGGSYLAAPNIGIQGSRAAAAIPLLATLICWGINGLSERIDRTMTMAGRLSDSLSEDDCFVLWSKPKTAVTVFRPLHCSTRTFHNNLPPGMLSTCELQKQNWLRSVAANPLADIEAIISTIKEVGHKLR